jgi:hypothetical protein
MEESVFLERLSSLGKILSLLVKKLSFCRPKNITI